MSTITFDTLKFANKLKELTTKDDLKTLEVRLEAKIQVVQWMLGFLLAGVASLVIKTFF